MKGLRSLRARSVMRSACSWRWRRVGRERGVLSPTMRRAPAVRRRRRAARLEVVSHVAANDPVSLLARSGAARGKQRTRCRNGRRCTQIIQAAPFETRAGEFQEPVEEGPGAFVMNEMVRKKPDRLIETAGGAAMFQLRAQGVKD